MTYDEAVKLLGDKTGMKGSQWWPKIIKPYLKDLTDCEILLAMPGTLEELEEKMDIDSEDLKKRVAWLDKTGVCIPRKRDRGTVYYFHADPIAIKDTMSYNWMYAGYPKTPEMERFMYYWDQWDSTDQIDDMWVDRDAEFVRAQKSGKRKFETGQIRVIPLPGTVKDGTKLDPIEDFNEICKAAPAIMVNECCCNWIHHHETNQVGNYTQSVNPKTGKPDNEVCMHFSPFGEIDYLVERGLGRQLTVEEAIEKGKEFAQRGLVMTANGGYPVVGQVCCCDSTGCAICHPKWEHNLHSFWESRFQPFIDEDKCVACGKCLKRCPFGVITMKKDMKAYDKGIEKAVIEIDRENCVGCGACVMGCKTEAIGLKVVRDKEWLIEAPTCCAIDDPEITGIGYTTTSTEEDE